MTEQEAFDLCSNSSSSSDEEVVLVKTKSVSRHRENSKSSRTNKSHSPPVPLDDDGPIDLTLDDESSNLDGNTDEGSASITSSADAKVPRKKDDSEISNVNKSASSSSCSANSDQSLTNRPQHEMVQYVDIRFDFSTKEPLGFNVSNNDAGRWIVDEILNGGQAERLGLQSRCYVSKVNFQEILSAHESPAHIYDAINGAMMGSDESVTIHFLTPIYPTTSLGGAGCDIDTVRGPVASDSVGTTMHDLSTTKFCGHTFRFQLFLFNPNEKFGFAVSDCLEVDKFLVSSHWLISEVEVNSQAAIMGIQKNYILFAVDGKSVVPSAGDGIQVVIQRAREDAIQKRRKVIFLMAPLPAPTKQVDDNPVSRLKELDVVPCPRDASSNEEPTSMQEEEAVTTGECESVSSIDLDLLKLSGNPREKEKGNSKKRRNDSVLAKKSGKKRGRRSTENLNIATKKAANISTLMPAKTALYLSKEAALHGIKKSTNDIARTTTKAVDCIDLLVQEVIMNGNPKPKSKRKSFRSDRKSGGDEKLKVGSRVYAKFPPDSKSNNNWYWGIISKPPSPSKIEVHVSFCNC